MESEGTNIPMEAEAPAQEGMNPIVKWILIIVSVIVGLGVVMTILAFTVFAKAASDADDMLNDEKEEEEKAKQR